MKQLKDFYDPTTSDKGTNHSYIEHVYSKEFEPFRHTANKVLEIGIYDGGSLRMWRDYFTKAEIYGIDIAKRCDINEPRIITLITDGYSPSVVELLPKSFDIIIDDGSHCGYGQTSCIKIYYPLVKSGGLLIIEDINSTESLNNLISILPQDCKHRVYDLRHLKNRWDDMILVVQKL